RGGRRRATRTGATGDRAAASARRGKARRPARAVRRAGPGRATGGGTMKRRNSAAGFWLGLVDSVVFPDLTATSGLSLTTRRQPPPSFSRRQLVHGRWNDEAR